MSVFKKINYLELFKLTYNFTHCFLIIFVVLFFFFSFFLLNSLRFRCGASHLFVLSSTPVPTLCCTAGADTPRPPHLPGSPAGELPSHLVLGAGQYWRVEGKELGDFSGLCTSCCLQLCPLQSQLLLHSPSPSQQDCCAPLPTGRPHSSALITPTPHPSVPLGNFPAVALLSWAPPCPAPLSDAS